MRRAAEPRLVAAPTRPSPACRERARLFAERARPLWGRTPYTNRRPMSVTGPYDGFPLLEFLLRRHPHVDEAAWCDDLARGHIEIDERVVVDGTTVVRAGNRIVHIVPDTIEPEVAVDVAVLFEDEAMVVVDKPAPLPVHPCGRYHRHTLTALWSRCFDGDTVRPVHRLDVDTTGLLVLAKHRDAARALSRQFEARTVDKHYFAVVKGVPDLSRFDLAASISRAPAGLGKRCVEPDAASAHTWCERVAVDDSGERALLWVRPSSGRTNQIRVHLGQAGHAIVGDAAYGGHEPLISGTSRLCLHAWRIALRHPDEGRVLEFETELPDWVSAFRGASDVE